VTGTDAAVCDSGPSFERVLDGLRRSQRTTSATAATSPRRAAKVAVRDLDHTAAASEGGRPEPQQLAADEIWSWYNRGGEAQGWALRAATLAVGGARAPGRHARQWAARQGGGPRAGPGGGVESVRERAHKTLGFDWRRREGDWGRGCGVWRGRGESGVNKISLRFGPAESFGDTATIFFMGFGPPKILYLVSTLYREL
jgi:hypothetical protein